VFVCELVFGAPAIFLVDLVQALMLDVLGFSRVHVVLSATCGRDERQ
jgi:hypothetical protein